MSYPNRMARDPSDERFASQNILAWATSLHMYAMDTYTTYDTKEMKDVRDYLAYRIETWHQTKSSFDSLAQLLIVEAIREFDRKVG